MLGQTLSSLNLTKLGSPKLPRMQDKYDTGSTWFLLFHIYIVYLLDTNSAKFIWFLCHQVHGPVPESLGYKLMQRTRCGRFVLGLRVNPNSKHRNS
jgi:hypothetical protein